MNGYTGTRDEPAGTVHPAVTDQWNAVRDAGKKSGEAIQAFARALLEAQLDAAGPITYTNRAARRARAKAERKSA